MGGETFTILRAMHFTIGTIAIRAAFLLLNPMYSRLALSVRLTDAPCAGPLAGIDHAARFAYLSAWF